MIKATIKFSVLGLTVLALAAHTVTAADAPAQSEIKKEAKPAVSKAERTGLAGPFHGTLTAKTDASISIKERTFEVNSETRIMKHGKPATLADAEIGGVVAGQFQKRDGKLIAKSIHFGGNGTESAQHVDKKGLKPVANPEAKTETKPDAAAKTK